MNEPITTPVKVLVCEDSPTIRKLLVHILTAQPGFEVIGLAGDGAEALAMTERLRPDVVTMDIAMPNMDGYEATRHIMTLCPTPIVIVSNLDVQAVEVSFKALRAGALTLLSKPAGPGSPAYETSARQLRSTLMAMARVKVVRRLEQRPKKAPETSEIDPARPVSAVAIAASAGGPSTLCQLFAGFPADYPLPILLVQHIARGFTTGLVSTLSASTKLQVRLATEGEQVQPGTIYVAPDDYHLAMSPHRRLVLSDSPPIDGLRPAANFTFSSLAAALGKELVAVVLTGMGHDGVVGLREVHESGGLVIAQSRESAIVFGMPAAAQEAGVTHAMWSLEQIGAFLTKLRPAQR